LGYRGGWLANFLVRQFILLPGLGLPNVLNSPQLLSNWPKRANPHHWKPIVPELLQYDYTPEKIAAALWPLLQDDSPECRRALKGFQQISASLSSDNSRMLSPGGAAQRVASGLIQATTL
jgi:lipid A disaccharide synthetase